MTEVGLYPCPQEGCYFVTDSGGQPACTLHLPCGCSAPQHWPHRCTLQQGESHLGNTWSIILFSLMTIPLPWQALHYSLPAVVLTSILFTYPSLENVDPFALLAQVSCSTVLVVYLDTVCPREMTVVIWWCGCRPACSLPTMARRASIRKIWLS